MTTGTTAAYVTIKYKANDIMPDAWIARVEYLEKENKRLREALGTIGGPLWDMTADQIVDYVQEIARAALKE